MGPTGLVRARPRRADDLTPTRSLGAPPQGTHPMNGPFGHSGKRRPDHRHRDARRPKRGAAVIICVAPLLPEPIGVPILVGVMGVLALCWSAERIA